MSKTLKIDPVDDVPVPYDTSDEFDAIPSKLEQLAVAGNTAELKSALGAQLMYDNPSDAAKEAELLDKVVKDGKSVRALRKPGVALAAAGFLKTYGQSLALNVTEARHAVKNKLFEIANCGDPRYELKALELLGKTSDLALFTERSEINVNFTDSSTLEEAIKDRVKRLLNTTTIDITPLSSEELDDELGISSRGRRNDPVQNEPEGETEKQKGRTRKTKKASVEGADKGSTEAA